MRLHRGPRSSNHILRVIDPGHVAAAVPPVTRLVWSRPPRIAVLPEARLDHQLAKSLVRDDEVMQLRQVLRRQGRSEIRVVLTYQAHDLFAEDIAMPPVARLTAFARNETRCAFGSHPFKQSKNLAALQAKQNRRILDPKFAAPGAHQRIKT
jgi:hypothetical protein